MGPCRPLTSATCSLITLAVLLSQVRSDKKISCDNVTVANGAVFRTSDSALSSSILVQCYPNYSLQPSEKSQLECIDGNVSLPLPQCVEKRNCSHSCDLQHGYCEPRDQHSFQSGDTIKFVCEDEYSLNSEIDTHTCRENGTWEQDVQPTCVLSGNPCKITESETIEYFLDPSHAERTLPHNSETKVLCKKGYYTIGTVNMTCNDGTLEPDFRTQCRFKGVDVEISYSYTDAGSQYNVISDSSVMNFEKDEQVNMTCKVSSKTGDGLPYPEVTWQYPARLRDYVEVHSGDTFIHTDYVNSVSQNNSIGVDDKKHYAQGVLRINPTMEVHSGEYTCVVKLVSYTEKHPATIKIKSEFVIAMYFLLIIPVVLFVIVHCFYRKATLSPFPAPNKLTKDMMQEVDKKKKLEELQANPAYQHIQVMGDRNHRGRRGCVVDI